MKPKKLLSFILTAAMAISLMPTFTLAASAATAATEKNITLGTAALSGYDSTNGYDYIYYGTYDNSPIKWRTLSMNGNDGTYTDGDGNTVASENAMLLLSEYALKKMKYDDDGKTNNGQTNVNDWRYSDVWDWCNNTDDNTSFISSSFTASEKAYLLKTSKANGEGYTDELKGDTFFLLSYAEAKSDYIKNDRIAKMSNASGSDVYWWLRSPNDHSNDVNCVYGLGNLSFSDVKDVNTAARPAFNLNLSSVLFTSAAVGGKSTFGKRQ